MLRKNWKNIFLICLLMLLIFSGCKNIFSPDDNLDQEPVFITVEVQYQRVDDNANCPIPFSLTIYPQKNVVYLAGLTGRNKKMQKLTEDIHVATVNDVKVNYDKYRESCYKINVLDSAFYDFYNQTGCHVRAHKLWLNGYLIQKIHREGKKEYVYVRFDENGIPHEQ